MRFMVLVIPDRRNYEAGVMPDEKLLAAMMKYNEDLAKAGVMLGGDGLHPTSKGTRITFKGGTRSVVDGPFTEARELVGGYWLWQVKSKAEAVEWASRAPMEEGATLEIRQVYEPAEFGPDIAKREGALMAEIAKHIETNKSRA